MKPPDRAIPQREERDQALSARGNPKLLAALPQSEAFNQGKPQRRSRSHIPPDRPKPAVTAFPSTGTAAVATMSAALVSPPRPDPISTWQSSPGSAEVNPPL